MLCQGEHLRALITADRDVVPNDDRSYRIALIEAFRRRGIFPDNVRSLSVDAVCWEDPAATGHRGAHKQLVELLRAFGAGSDGEDIFLQIKPDWGLSSLSFRSSATTPLPKWRCISGRTPASSRR